MPTSGESRVIDIPFHVPSIGEEEVLAVSDTLRSGWITTGPQTLQFEEEFAAYVGAPHAVACCSGTAALHLALRAFGIGPGDEVVTTPYTFVASTETILYVGAKPVFVDVEPGTLNMDPEAVEAAITPRTKAILPVHIAGFPCEMDRITEIAARRGLRVLDDAAHALPASFRGRRIGSIGDATAFSFYATKNLTTGEGGMVTTSDPKLAEKMRVLRLHGIQGDAWKRYTKGGRWFYEVVDQGYKYNMSDIQAAMGRVQLRKLDALDLVRREHARRFRRAFADLPLVLQRDDDEDRRSALHLFIVRLDPARTGWSREGLIEALREEGIYTSVHFIPVHLHPYYRDLGFRRGMFPVAEAAYDQAITLPFYPAMAPTSLERLLEVVRALLSSRPA
jgi:dTDP-4-amino-4,6-dideoxygalactose transaminase